MTSNQYNLNLSNFNGPLDLLLALVKDKKMDILSIDLVELATEYIKVIDTIKTKNIDLASDYLVMAATLLQIKAHAFLKTRDEDKTVASSKDLLHKLIEHQQFKNISQLLRLRETQRQQIFIKEQASLESFDYEIDESHLDGSLDAVRIISALRRMFERTNANRRQQATIAQFSFSPAERRLEILQMLKHKRMLSFAEVFLTPSINHFVVTVVTILDMARKQELTIKQENQFSPIWVERKGAYAS